MPESGTVECIRTRAKLEELRGAWNDLPQAKAQPLLRAEWFLRAIGPLVSESRLRIITLSRGSRLRAAAPLVWADGIGGRLEFIGAGELYEPSGLLYGCPSDLEDLARAIVASGRAAVLQRLRNGDEVAAAFRRVLGRRGAVVLRRTATSRWADTRGTWAEFEEKMSPRRRYDLRRARRRAEEHGTVSCEISCPDRERLAELLPEILRVEAAGWKGRRGTALNQAAHLKSFFEAYLNDAAAAGFLRIGMLRIGAEAAAVVVGLQFGGRFWVLKIGFDERFARCSPGLQLIHETVRYACDEGLEGYEFLGSDEPWEAVWASGVREYSTVAAYPFTARGLAPLGLDVLRAVRRRYLPFRAHHR